MNTILIGPCAVFYCQFSFLIQWYRLDDHQRRFMLLSGEGQVKVRFRSGKKRSNLKVKVRSRSGSDQVKRVKFKRHLIFLHKKGIYSMQLITGDPMVLLVLLYVVHNGNNRVEIFDVINFEQFVAITLPTIELPSLNLTCR